MKPKKRQKMCYNCEGEVDLDVIVCPFCAADLRAEKPEQQAPSYSQAMNLKNLNTQQSLYPSQSATAVQQQEEVQEEEPQTPVVEEKQGGVILPTILMTLGAQLFLFGFLMLIFSKNGLMTLKWDASYWYLYSFISIPFLFFGYKNLSE